jgi:hypothetical protein
MAILHYQLKKANEDVQINTGIHSQNFIFRRAIIKSIPLGAAASVNGGGVIVQPSHFSGMEIVTSTTTESNDILLGINELVAINNIYYDMEFDSENINEAFNVRTLKYDRSGPAVFGTNPGDIVSIDIYFQFSSLYNYDSIY